jgi:DEAD/DEAH box helicase domain-containing protein
MKSLDDSLHRALEEKRSWDRQLKRLRDRIKDNESETVRTSQILEELDALTNEKDGIARLRKSLVERNSWAFFCDEGLLPNYAFPETGVQLRSLFWRKTQPGSSRRYTYITKDYQRPAGVALEELAPENVFYAGGRKVTIDRVDLKSSALETWRFCPDCAHAEPLGSPGFGDSVCPRCGHGGWCDSGQISQLLRLRQVYSRSELSRSQIGDDAEEREPLFYSKRLLIDFQPADQENIYFSSTDEGFPVAVEFIKAATFREVNFGKKNAKGIMRTIAGSSEARPGFVLCPECGAVKKRNAFEHAPECASYNRALSNATTIQVSYLYRDYTSEAIRLLIPVLHSGLDAETRLESMKAALYLGLKRRFGGKVDHLVVSDDSGPSADGRRLDYLVIHDTVPGALRRWRRQYRQIRT